MKRGGLAIALVIIFTGALRWFSPSGPAPGGSESLRPPGKLSSEKNTENKTKSATADNFSHGHPAEGIESALIDYFGLEFHESVSVQDAASPRTSETQVLTPTESRELMERYAHWFVPKAERPHVRFAIAILPDPAHTQLNLYFDRGIEAIEEAAQESNFLFDRATMPWDLEPHPESPDFAKREEEEAAKTLRESYPGLLIFRSAVSSPEIGKQGGDVPHTLLVFVVGEAPTGGIRKAQFTRAVQIIDAIQPATDPSSVPAQKKLLILGPTFSGSLHSLSQSLSLDSPGLKGRRILVFSGTVRGTAARCSFEAGLPSDAFFVPFQDNESHLLDKFVVFAVQNKLYSLSDISVLSEDETAYGRAPKSDDAPVSGKNFQCNVVAEKKPSDLDQNCDAQWISSCLHYIQFPRGISQFRSAYARQTDLASSQRVTGEGKPVLPLDLEATGNEDDSVAPYAKVQFPLSQEAVMLGIITRLHQRHPRLIVLRSSDPVDQLFLARYLRQNFPEARIVIVSPDLLFAREDDGLLHGVLGLSSYPLVPDVEPFLSRVNANDKPRSERSFPSTNDLGTYNAFAALLAAQDNPDFPEKFLSAAPADPLLLPRAPYVAYGSFVDWRNPPSTGFRLWPDDWVTILGRDGYWPLSALPNERGSGLHATAGFAFYPDPDEIGKEKFSMQRHTSRPWIFAYALVSLALFIHSLAIRYGSIFSSQESLATFGPVETPADPPEPNDSEWAAENRPNRGRRSALLAVGTISLFLALESMVGVRFAATVASEGRGWTLFLSVLPFLLTLFVSWHLAFRRGSQTVAYVLVVVCFLATLFVNLDAIGPASWMSSLTAYRAMHVTSGVSPLLPFLFLFGVGYCLMWFELRGLSVTDCRRPRLPLRGDVPPSTYRVSEEEVRELHHISIPLTVPWRILKAILCLVPLVVLTASYDIRPILTMEGLSYDRWYALLLFFSLALFLGCLFRLIAIWNETKRFLGGLDNLPLRDAFRRLQDFSWSLLWSPSGSSIRDSYKLVSRELECLRRVKLALENPSCSGDARISTESSAKIKSTVGEANSALDEAGKAYAATMKANAEQNEIMWFTVDDAKTTGELICCFAVLQTKLAKVAGVLMQETLARFWEEDCSPVASTAPRDAITKKTPFQRLAEEFVSMVYANFLTSTLLRMRTLAVEAIGIYVFLLLSISFYPFEPNPAMFTLAVLLVAVMGVVLGFVYAQMHKDVTLSRLTSTAEGELGMEFWMQFIAAGAVPVLSLLAVQFPAVSRIVSGFLEPALQTVK